MGLIVRTRFGLSRRMPVGIGEGGRAGLLWLQTVLLLEDQVLWTTPFFVHEGPRRAAKNTFFVHEGPRRTPLSVSEENSLEMTQTAVAGHVSHTRNGGIVPSGEHFFVSF